MQMMHDVDDDILYDDDYCLHIYISIDVYRFYPCSYCRGWGPGATMTLPGHAGNLKFAANELHSYTLKHYKQMACPV